MKAKKKHPKTPAATTPTTIIELSEEALQRVTGGYAVCMNLLTMEHEVLKNAAQNLRA